MVQGRYVKEWYKSGTREVRTRVVQKWQIYNEWYKSGTTSGPREVQERYKRSKFTTSGTREEPRRRDSYY